MGATLSAPPRVIVYVFASPLLAGVAGVEDPALVAEVQAICDQEGVELVDSVVDRGPAKRRREHYPVLARLARGEADLLLVVRSPLYRRGPVVDLLESCCPEGPYVWVSLDELRDEALLPPRTTAAPAAPRRRLRPGPAQRARALRTQGQGLRRIGQTLTIEGYLAPGGTRWTTSQVAKLLGLEVMEGGKSEPAVRGEPAPAPR